EYSAAGTYEVTLTSTSGCDSVATLILTVNDVSISVLAPEISCTSNTGTITITAEGGSTPYEYSINGGTNYQSSNIFTDLNAGNYSIIVRDAIGCTSETTVTITQEICCTLTAVATAPTIECNQASGTITVTASNGTAPIQYSINGGTNYQSSNIFNNLAAGSYTITVRDANDCIVTTDVTIAQQLAPTLVITNPPAVCAPATVDITTSAITAGSDPNLTLSYWTNASATTSLPNPTAVSAGTYYIKATAANGCETIAAVIVSITDQPNLVINDPAICAPNTVDLTAAAITAGSEPNLTLSYWTDADATQTLANANAIAVPGTYYIKAVSGAGCEIVLPVNVTINAQPNLVITDPPAVCPPLNVNLTAAAITAGSDAGLTFTYWRDAAASQPLNNANSINAAGTYYIKATNANGCEIIQPVTVSVLQGATLRTTDPAPVCSPATVDITSPAITAGSDPNLELTYWLNENATDALNNPRAIGRTGTYFIRALNADGCQDIQPVRVVINPLPTITIEGPDSLCLGLNTDLIVRFTGQGPWTFTYTDGSQSRTINNVGGNTYRLNVGPSTTTTYTITSVTDRNCTNDVSGENISHQLWITIPIDGVRLPPVFTTANTPTQLQGRNIGPNYNMFNWSPTLGLNRYNILDPIFTYDKRVEYKIEMRSEAGCVTVDTLVVQPVNTTEPGLKPAIYVPTVWTPNGDGRNDRLFPFTINIIELRWFRVFNRWGELVYETSTLGAGWDGIYKGKIQPIDTYTWTAEAVGINGEIFRLTGLAALMR
ncbi:T9SS type B sorting domain-containing protein, partial [Flavihumibacter sp.]|uniref:T9SS type B sorting domain-containing protein n=1 Tax=Flavihumibacter sp. TaxID=1913981 RepID=UPI002FC6B8FA